MDVYSPNMIIYDNFIGFEPSPSEYIMLVMLYDDIKYRHISTSSSAKKVPMYPATGRWFHPPTAHGRLQKGPSAATTPTA
jgi:hypothetical protein